MRRKEDLLASEILQRREYLVLPVADHTFTSHFQTLAHWHLLVLCFGQVLVKFIEARMIWIIKVDLWWWVIERLPPKFDLLFAKLVDRLLFTFAL